MPRERRMQGPVRRPWGPGRLAPAAISLVSVAAIASAAAATPAGFTNVSADVDVTALPAAGLDDFPDPVDRQSWVLPEWQTIDDYRPIPNVDWNSEALQPAKKLNAAFVLGDFADRDFVVTMEPGSDLFCLPDVGCNPFLDEPVAREDVAQWYADFFVNTPSALNNGHTVNEYWLEDSYGKIAVNAVGFGPYRMEGKEHEYGLGGSDAGGGGGACPQGDNCGEGGAVLLNGFDFEVTEASAADVAAGQAALGQEFDFRYLVHAAYDESGTWQEFGEMLFEEREDVTDQFGPPNAAELPDDENWAPTRYIEWSSFAAAEGIWSHAVPGVLSTQGENDGHAVFAHELSHIFGVLDNYSNPYAPNARRTYTGTWANLSRGAFNGPGGNHTRWLIPPTQGATMGSHHMLRNKIRLGFTPPNEVLFVTDEVLLAGPQFATVFPRAYPLAPTTTDTGLHGVHISLAEDASSCDVAQDHTCDGGGYDNYTLEVVDRIGFDSFTTDHGVLITKNKNADTSPFMWITDSHPDDINEATPPAPNQDREIHDFVRPLSGEVVPITQGDQRQLADATFHAGTGPDVVSEAIDEANRLHFYVLDKQVDDRGVMTYRVAVRHLDAPVTVPSAIELGEVLDAHSAEPGKVGVVTTTVTNTGLATDLVRLRVEAPDGVTTRLDHDVIELSAGETREVAVWFRVPSDQTSRDDLGLRLVAQSEIDPAGSAETTLAGRVAPASDPVVVDAPDPAPAEPPATPVTGGGAVAAFAGMVLLTAATRLRRPLRRRPLAHLTARAPDRSRT